MEYVSTHNFIRCAFEQCISNYRIHFCTINDILLTFEQKQSITLIPKSRCHILHALKINKQYSLMTTAASEINTDVSVLYKPNIFSPDIC